MIEARDLSMIYQNVDLLVIEFFSVKEQVYELGFQQYQCTVKLKTNIVNLDFSYGISINALNVSG